MRTWAYYLQVEGFRQARTGDPIHLMLCVRILTAHHPLKAARLTEVLPKRSNMNGILEQWHLNSIRTIDIPIYCLYDSRLPDESTIRNGNHLPR